MLTNRLVCACPLVGVYEQCFAEQLIPAFQSATQRMFTQITEALQKSE
jgi:hypothetical protein